MLGSVWGSHLLLSRAEGQGPALTIALLLPGSAYLASGCWAPEDRPTARSRRGQQLTRTGLPTLGLTRRAVAETLEPGGGRGVTRSGPHSSQRWRLGGTPDRCSRRGCALARRPEGQVDTAGNISLWQRSTRIGAGLGLMETAREPTRALRDQPCRWERCHMHLLTGS